MPYKDPEKQKAAQRRSYEKNKRKIKIRQDLRRNELGVYKRERVRELLEYVRQQKAGKPCVDCGHSFHHAAMDFDHIRGEKFASVSQLAAYGYSIRSIDEEIAKCELVCANCHRVRTYQRKHGSEEDISQGSTP